MLWSHPDFAGGNERPSGSGIPLLFPFPGRIGKAKYSFGGREYQLEPGDAFGNAIHGFVHKRPWRVVEQAAGKDRRRVSGVGRRSVAARPLAERFSDPRQLRSARARTAERYPLREHGRRAAAVRLRHAHVFSPAAHRRRQRRKRRSSTRRSSKIWELERHAGHGADSAGAGGDGTGSRCAARRAAVRYVVHGARRRKRTGSCTPGCASRRVVEP